MITRNFYVMPLLECSSLDYGFLAIEFLIPRIKIWRIFEVNFKQTSYGLRLCWLKFLNHTKSESAEKIIKIIPI